MVRLTVLASRPGSLRSRVRRLARSLISITTQQKTYEKRRLERLQNSESGINRRVDELSPSIGAGFGAKVAGEAHGCWGVTEILGCETWPQNSCVHLQGQSWSVPYFWRLPGRCPAQAERPAKESFARQHARISSISPIRCRTSRLNVPFDELLRFKI
jgi:hypothetical protein